MSLRAKECCWLVAAAALLASFTKSRLPVTGETVSKPELRGSSIDPGFMATPACPAPSFQLFTDIRAEEVPTCGLLYCGESTHHGQHYHGCLGEPLSWPSAIYVSDPNRNSFHEFVYCPDAQHIAANDRFSRHGHLKRLDMNQAKLLRPVQDAPVPRDQT